MSLKEGFTLTLFILKINSIADVIPSSFEKSSFLMISQSFVLLEIWL